jgi:hypothetical protein
MALKITDKTELMTVLDSITNERITKTVARARQRARQAAATAEESDTSSSDEESPPVVVANLQALIKPIVVPHLLLTVANREWSNIVGV